MSSVRQSVGSMQCLQQCIEQLFNCTRQSPDGTTFTAIKPIRLTSIIAQLRAYIADPLSLCGPKWLVFRAFSVHHLDDRQHQSNITMDAMACHYVLHVGRYSFISLFLLFSYGRHPQTSRQSRCHTRNTTTWQFSGRTTWTPYNTWVTLDVARQELDFITHGQGADSQTT